MAIQKVFGQIGLGKQCWPRSDCSCRSSLIRVYTVWNSISIFLMHYSVVKLLCLNIMVITANFSGVWIFLEFCGILIYLFQSWWSSMAACLGSPNVWKHDCVMWLRQKSYHMERNKWHVGKIIWILKSWFFWWVSQIFIYLFFNKTEYSKTNIQRKNVNILQIMGFYTPPQKNVYPASKKWRAIILYPSNGLSVRPYVCLSEHTNQVLCDTLSLGLGDYCHIWFIPSIIQSLNYHFVTTKPFYVTGHLKKSHLTSSYAYKKSHNIQFVRMFVCLSVCTSFLDSNSSSFWPIFFNFCMDIDIREEWFGIADGLNSFLNSRVMDFDWCKNTYPEQMDEFWKFCICIGIYKIHVVSSAHYFRLIFNRVMALDLCKKCVFLSIFRTNVAYMLYLTHFTFGQFLTELWPMIYVRICLCSISCELICGFLSNFVYALILTRCRFRWLNNIFCSFTTELWPLIDVEMSFMLNIFWINWWILIKFCNLYALILTKCKWGQLQIIFRHFSTELWPLIDVRILFPFNILRTNWWILMKFCVCSKVQENFMWLTHEMALDWC